MLILKSVWTMSSETSTDVRLKPDAMARGRPDTDVRLKPDRTAGTHRSHVQPDDSLQPWQLFVLAALACATVIIFMARGRGIVMVVLFTALMASAALVGIAALRALLPLVSRAEDRTAMIGHRTRAALEREKWLALRSIKELEFDRAMGKLSEGDWREMSTRLRARATRLMRQLDAGSGYRDRIEHDLAQRLEQAAATAVVTVGHTCTACDTENDADARFCKNCGDKL
jgi:hypothetical protein